LPLAPDSTVILGSESHGTHIHILLSDGSWSIQNFFFVSVGLTNLPTFLSYGKNRTGNNTSINFSIVFILVVAGTCLRAVA
jgi:hypothetical protein